MAQGLGARKSPRQSQTLEFSESHDAPANDRIYLIPSQHGREEASSNAKSTADQAEAPQPNIDLLSLLAHQLLTPLALIDAAAQKMARHAGDMSPEEVQARANRIRHASDRLAKLARSLLDRARLEQEQRIISETCSLADLIARAHEPIRHNQPERLFWIDVRAETVAGDPLLLEQLLTILLCNAAKYSAPDMPIGIAVAEHEDSVRVSVTDQGIGIPEADKALLFEPCFRGSNTNGKNGAGMGLHLANRIAQLHGGTITVESQEGEGSTFTVELPRAP